MNDSKMTKEDRKSKRYIIGNIVLAGFLALIFLLVCLYFSTPIDTSQDLSYETRAEIGEKNMIRTVVIFGALSAIYGAAFYKKVNFKLSTKILFGCWVLGALFVALISVL